MSIFGKISSLVILCLLLTGYFPLPAQAQVHDFGLWPTLGVKCEVFRNFDITLAAEMGTRNYASEIDDIRGDVFFDYKVCRYLKAGAGYVYMPTNLGDGVYVNKHRWLVYVTGKLPAGIATISLRERYQETWTVGKSEPKRLLRNRLQCDVDIPESRFSPFVSAEPHLSLNCATLWNIPQIRYSLGSDIHLGRHSLSVYWWGFQNTDTSTEPVFHHYLCMDYFYRIPSGKKR